MKLFVLVEPVIFCFTEYLWNNFETAPRRALTVASLSDLHSYYLGQEGFCEPANFWVLGDSCGQRATLAANENLFFLLLNACRTTNSLKGGERLLIAGMSYLIAVRMTSQEEN